MCARLAREGYSDAIVTEGMLPNEDKGASELIIYRTRHGYVSVW